MEENEKEFFDFEYLDTLEQEPEPEPELQIELAELPQWYDQQEAWEDFVSSNIYPLPRSVSITVSSLADPGAVPTRVYLFNQTMLNNVIFNGGKPINYTYSDGFNGVVQNNIITKARAGVGAICYGVALRFITTSTGLADDIGLQASAPLFAYFTSQNNIDANNLDVNSNFSRRDRDLSITVIPCVCNVNSFSQFSFIIPQDTDVTITFYFAKDYAR